MSQNTRRSKVARMTLLAMMIALLIVLAYVNIPMPMGLSITFNMIPVAVAAMAMGVTGGAIVGGAFGLISFLQCFGIFGTFVCTRLLGLGLVAAWGCMIGNNLLLCAFFVYHYLSGRWDPFMTLMVLFFGGSEKLAGPIAEKGVILYIITSVGINAVVEMAVAALVTGAAGTALRKARLI